MARDLVSFSFTHNHNCKLNFKFNRARDLDRMNDFRQTDNGLNQECVPVLGLKNAVEFESAADLMTAATRCAEVAQQCLAQHHRDKSKLGVSFHSKRESRG